MSSSSFHPAIGSRPSTLGAGRSGSLLPAPGAGNDGVEMAIDMIREIFMDGAAHGFFEFTVKGEMIKDQICCVLIKAGKSYRVTFSTKALDR